MNVGEGAGAVAVGECQPGGVLVGFAAELLAGSRFGAMACVFAIPANAPINENRRSARENVAAIAREIAGLASLAWDAKWMAWLGSDSHSAITEESNGAWRRGPWSLKDFDTLSKICSREHFLRVPDSIPGIFISVFLVDIDRHDFAVDACT